MTTFRPMTPPETGKSSGLIITAAEAGVLADMIGKHGWSGTGDTYTDRTNASRVAGRYARALRTLQAVPSGQRAETKTYVANNGEWTWCVRFTDHQTNRGAS
jgi:hypothetical protein